MAFYYLNKDYYSKFAKISTFVLLVLIPGFILLIVGGLSKILDILDPVESQTGP